MIPSKLVVVELVKTPLQHWYNSVYNIHEVQMIMWKPMMQVNMLMTMTPTMVSNDYTHDTNDADDDHDTDGYDNNN